MDDTATHDDGGVMSVLGLGVSKRQQRRTDRESRRINAAIDAETDSLRPWLDAYHWLIVRLESIFGAHRVWMVESDAGHRVGICVAKIDGTYQWRHAMWVERQAHASRYSLNQLPEERRETVVRHFIRDAKHALSAHA